MGSTTWDPSDWDKHKTATASKSTAGVFTRTAATGAKAEFLPANFKMRESRDSTVNPLSTPLIVALDVTGSMGMCADIIAREGLGILFTEILNRKPITDPHLMFMGIGDVVSDDFPVQASQFEAGNVIVDQLTGLYLEKGGGGNCTESYDAAWYMAAFRTSIDSFEKRGKKGYLFTIGDEESPNGITRAHAKQFFGDDQQRDLSAEDLYNAASRYYEIFHIVVEQGSHFRYSADKVKSSWRSLLGQRVIQLSDYTKLAEVITSTIEVIEGRDRDAVAKSWSGDTSLVVSKAVAGLPVITAGKTSATGLVSL